MGIRKSMKLKTKKIHSENKFKRVFNLRMFASLLVAALALFQIYLSMQSSSLSEKLSETEDSAREILVKNKELKTELIESVSYNSLNDAANQFGYNKSFKTVYIDKYDFVAKLR